MYLEPEWLYEQRHSQTHDGSLHAYDRWRQREARKIALGRCNKCWHTDEVRCPICGLITPFTTESVARNFFVAEIRYQNGWE